MDADLLKLVGLLDAERQALARRPSGGAEVTIEALRVQPANEFDDDDLGTPQTAVPRVANNMQDPQPLSVCQIDSHARGR